MTGAHGENPCVGRPGTVGRLPRERRVRLAHRDAVLSQRVHCPFATELLGKSVTLGHSREPPASHGIELQNYKAAPLQAVGKIR